MTKAGLQTQLILVAEDMPMDDSQISELGIALKLAEALFPLVKTTSVLQHGLEQYRRVFEQRYAGLRAAKLGYEELTEEGAASINQLTKLFRRSEVDLTLFYRLLTQLSREGCDRPALEDLLSAFYRVPDGQLAKDWSEWLHLHSRVWKDTDNQQSTALMMRQNPAIVFRDYIAHNIITAAEAGDFAPIEDALIAFAAPYSTNAESSRYYGKCRIGLKIPPVVLLCLARLKA